ncbi:siroheme synthase CysG [Algiphilus sp. W345]|uniref:Siroheme synthase n=1 Tax=Banduia mediterranea TaxID=3075609 RepID=A0ABU2WHN6_9GAMM|nr:siroheme synthase CysG [Algiphilus sp. W345]MDT0497396.1 siroheme synthase CysG [Algiphilus sp. W345]
MSAPWPYFPIFVRLSGEPVLVVGGGEVALRKVRLLRRAGADVRLVAKSVLDELKPLRVAEAFDPAQLAGCRMAIAATDDPALNRRVAAEAEARGVWVNAVDDPQASRWITPAIVDRSPLLIALSSAGAAPVLVRRWRERLETMLPSGYGRLLSYIGERRAAIRERVPQAMRRRIWEAFLDGPAPEAVLAGDEAAADAVLELLLTDTSGDGEVYLVGAGPGDPDLLTLRAVRLMQQCDVVLHDALVSPAIMELVRRDAERLYVGKKRDKHTLPQQDINGALVRLAREGKRVLRLKGGDPFVFGRGGEEIAELAAAGIPFQVVPGITAANGCAAYAGIPLTHRDYAQACIFVTGHPKKDGSLDLHWDQLARRGQTVVIYMGLNTLPDVCARLIDNGLPADWPAAVVEEGTSARQCVVTGTLASLPQAVRSAAVEGASLVIVGEVVRLREQLAWFKNKA